MAVYLKIHFQSLFKDIVKDVQISSVLLKILLRTIPQNSELQNNIFF